MSGAGFLRLKKLKGSGIIGAAARHNRRVIQAEMGSSPSINPDRSPLNETLRGPPTADGVAVLAKHLMAAAGVGKLRRDAVMGLELVFSLPPDHQLDDRAYFAACTAWTASRFGGDANVLSADIHRDEAAPHCHVLLLPLVNGRMAGSDLVGNRRKLSETHTDFHLKVASRYGLKKATNRLQGASKRNAAASVLGELQKRSDAALQSAIWPPLRDAIEHDPAPFLDAMGLEVKLPTKKLRSMTAIFTSPGKGPKHERNPIGFGAQPATRSLCSVGFAPAPLPEAETIESSNISSMLGVAPPDQPVIETVRVRECDLDPAHFDHDTGEHISVPRSSSRC